MSASNCSINPSNILSTRLYHNAQKTIPGGVNSPVRSFHAVGGTPIFMQRGAGAHMYDVDGNAYIDYLCSWGPLILGHTYPKVVSAVKEAIEKGFGFGTPTEVEVELAEKISELMPNIEMIRMVNSGTEATMSAIRLARGYTHRDKIVKFAGCYHGHSDSLLINAGSGVLSLSEPSSPGVPVDLVQHSLVATFNNLDSVQQLFEKYAREIACIIIEPIAGNMNCIPANPSFLQGLRELCDQYDALLIFDEVMTGFRVGLGGAQHYYQIKPDLTTLGKVIGGGLPVGAFGGRKEIMEYMAPIGPVYQAGTLSGNPIAMTAGLTTLNEISKPGFYDKLDSITQRLTMGLEEIANNYHIPFASNQICSMFGLFFTDEEQITQYQQALNCNIERFKQFFHGMLDLGVYFAPSAYESGFTSSAHTEDIVDTTLNAAEKIFKGLQ